MQPPGISVIDAARLRPVPAGGPPQPVPPAPAAVPHLFTVDVEEYFQVSAFDHVVSRDDWATRESRVEHSVDLLLELLARHSATGTFFTLGWVAARHPALVRRIAASGHEVASHGWEHRRVTSLGPKEFRQDVRRTRALLEHLAGMPVVGYRAPSFSIAPGWEWAFDILLEEGYLYDSSLFPIRRPGYGYPDAQAAIHRVERTGGMLRELPMTTIVWAGLRLPASGGAYFRHFPYALTRRAFREHRDHGRSAVFYVHPWELDALQPRLPVSLLTRLRHYRGISRVLPRLEQLLSEFRFSSVIRCVPLGWRGPTRTPARAG